MKYLHHAFAVFFICFSFDIHAQDLLNCRNTIPLDENRFGVENDQMCFRYPTCGEGALNSNSDNWGVENGETCIVFQTCSHRALDLDSEGKSDGWGWENEESCIIKDDLGPQYPNCQIGTPIDEEGFGIEAGEVCYRYPFCSSQQFDLDADGWGRENGAICIVADLSTFSLLHANCSNAVTPDINGMGLENDRVCYRFPSCDEHSLEEGLNNWAIENGRVCVVHQTCSRADIPVDENGYGIENLERCIVPEVRLPNCRNGIAVDDNGRGCENDLACQRYPTCSESAVNLDGDKWGREIDGEICLTFQACSSAQVGENESAWGWENNESCSVVERYGPAIAACSNSVAVDEEGLGLENGKVCQRYPRCSDATTDINGDNWGREEDGAICVVTQTCNDINVEVDENGLGIEEDRVCVLPEPRYPSCRNAVTVAENGFGVQDDQFCQRYPSCHGAAADPDGDHWGRENNAWCVMHQTCSDKIIDGIWAWENNARCRVAKPYGPAYPNCSNGIPTDDLGMGMENEAACFRFPTCSRPELDLNSDGWGRENDDICIVYQSCSDSDVDADGDNIGLENEELCLVHQECQSTESDPDGDNFGFEFAKVCVISEESKGMTRKLDTQLSNANATSVTVNLYNYLVNLPKGTTNRVLSGAFGGYTAIGGPDVFSLKQSEDIFAATGEKPAIYACDYVRGWRKHETPGNLVSYECNETLKDLYLNQGGLVQISNHLPSPIPIDGGDLKSTISNEYYAHIFEPGHEIRMRWLSVLDKVAEGLLDLQEAGVPVLFRPLHEMNGEWFWWGTESKNSSDAVRFELFKQLYIDMHKYYSETKALNNLIWVFAPDARRGFKSQYYPGAEYVDIVGLDAYSASPTEQFILDGYAELMKLNKPFAFTEVGPSEAERGKYDYQALIHAIRSFYPETVYFLAWNNTWSPVENINADAFYGHGWITNLGEVATFPADTDESDETMQ